MDLLEVQTIVLPSQRADLPPWTPDAALLGGGTWLFSEPQPGLRSLVDLTALGWPPLEPGGHGLRIAATCTIAALEAFAAPADWIAAPLFAQCCRALLGSFKVWATATVGGNVCLALPAAPMLALTVALDGEALVWQPSGGDIRIPMAAFATGPRQTVLAPGELLRAIELPADALRRRSAMRQISLTAHGRSAALLVATLDPAGRFALTITASTPQPLHTAWAAPPTAADLDAFIAGLPPSAWYDDVHGAPAWRRHITRLLAADLLGELTP